MKIATASSYYFLDKGNKHLGLHTSAYSGYITKVAFKLQHKNKTIQHKNMLQKKKIKQNSI